LLHILYVIISTGTTCEIGGYHSGVIKDSSLLGCVAGSLDKLRVKAPWSFETSGTTWVLINP